MRPEAGWYPDPTDDTHLRWWDGSTWTERRTSAAGAHPYHVEPEPPRRREVDLAKPAPGAPAVPTGPGTDVDPVRASTPAAPGDRQDDPWSQTPVLPIGYGQTVPESPAQTSSHPGAGYAAAPMAPSGQPLANQGIRLLARLIDYGLLIAVQWLVTTPWRGPYLEALSRYQDSVEAGRPDPFGFLNDPAYSSYVLAAVVAAVVLTGLYEIPLVKWRGATLGKLACGIAIVSTSGGRLTWGQAIGRWAALWPLGQVTCGLFTLIDGAWCLWDPDRECLHDKMASTRVVSKRR